MGAGEEEESANPKLIELIIGILLPNNFEIVAPVVVNHFPDPSLWKLFPNLHLGRW